MTSLQRIQKLPTLVGQHITLPASLLNGSHSDVTTIAQRDQVTAFDAGLQDAHLGELLKCRNQNFGKILGHSMGNEITNGDDDITDCNDEFRVHDLVSCVDSSKIFSPQLAFHAIAIFIRQINFKAVLSRYVDCQVYYNQGSASDA